MNKKMKKANKALSDALSFCNAIASKAKKYAKPVVSTKEPVKKELPKIKPLPNFTIVKMQKGDFRVELEGKLIDKRFKSLIKAEEWVSNHR